MLCTVTAANPNAGSWTGTTARGINTGETRWVFGARDSGAYLIKFSWIPIVRHQAVKGAASPDDPGFADYWANRRRKRKPPPLDAPTLRLLKAQKGRCPERVGHLLYADQEPQPQRNGRSGSPPPLKLCGNEV